MLEIKVQDTRRPCTVYDKDGIQHKAMFHLWVVEEKRTEYPQADWGSSIYNRRVRVRALVEYEDGEVSEVAPDHVRFVDGGGFDDYVWPEDM